MSVIECKAARGPGPGLGDPPWHQIQIQQYKKIQIQLQMHIQIQPYFGSKIQSRCFKYERQWWRSLLENKVKLLLLKFAEIVLNYVSDL